MSSEAPAKPGSANRHVWRLAWPNIISNLLFTTVGFLHIKIVAELGTSAVAAVTTGHRIFFLVQAILMGVSVAATAMIARAWGAQEVRQAELISWTSIVLSVGIAALLSIPVLTVPHGLASLFGLDAQTTEMAARFIFWLGLFNVFSAISMMLSTALRAIGDVITPLWFLFFSSLVNVALSWVLAYGIGPFPDMGIEGVALGGSFGASVVTVLFTIIWWRGKFSLKPIAGGKIEWPMMKQLLRIGAPSVIEQGIIQLAFLAFFAVIAQYGTEAFAAYGIGISLVAFSIVIGFGFGIATATLVGQHLGAGQPDHALMAVTRSLRMAVAAMTILSILLAVYAEPLARFMIEDDEVVELTVIFIYFIAFAQPLMAFEFTLGGALRGAGDTRSPLIATFCGIILGRLIPALVFLWMDLSVYWIFAVMLFDYIIKAIILIHRYRARHWLEVKFDS